MSCCRQPIIDGKEVTELIIKHSRITKGSVIEVAMWYAAGRIFNDTIWQIMKPRSQRPELDKITCSASTNWNRSINNLPPDPPHPAPMGNAQSHTTRTAKSRRLPEIKFRVLVIGRANAGKTSILKRVCETTESPTIYRAGKEVRRPNFCFTSRVLQATNRLHLTRQWMLVMTAYLSSVASL